MSATDYKAATDDFGAVSSGSAPPMMVHVVAPSSLPEGYTFEAQVGNDPERTFTVEVVSIRCFRNRTRQPLAAAHDALGI
jgi:hypothetical protein